MPIKKVGHHQRVFNGAKMVYRIKTGKGIAAMPDEMPLEPLKPSMPKALKMPVEDRKLQRQKLFADLAKVL